MWNPTLTSVIVATLLLLAAQISSAASEENVSVPSPKGTNLQSNDVKDSPLERVHVKQETGFDGKVRSIRFGLEPEKANKPDGDGSKVQADDNSTPKSGDTDDASSSSTSKSDSSVSPSSTAPSSRSKKMAKGDVLMQVASDSEESSRLKRAIKKSLSSDNELNDLVAEEAKVFRPLFVYRQQVARRLELRNDRSRSGISPHRIYKKTKPNNYGDQR